MPEAVAAILLRIPFLIVSSFVMGFGKKISLIVRVGTCFASTAGPGVAAALAPYRADPNKEIEPTLLISLFVAIFAGYLSAFASLKKKKLGISVQAVTVGALVATWLEAFALSGYQMTSYECGVNWRGCSLELHFAEPSSDCFLPNFISNCYRCCCRRRCRCWCCWCCGCGGGCGL